MGNRFLVGDVKQSIYRFRLADPKIFRDYAQAWRGEERADDSAAENFRSRESLLDFVNSVFELLMREEIGGVDYDAEARAAIRRAGPTRGTQPRQESVAARGIAVAVQRQPRRQPGGRRCRRRAIWRTWRKRKRRRGCWRTGCASLVAQGHEIWDEDKDAFRAAEWRDMAVLLRAPAGKAEMYAKEFERAGVPLVVERGGFYDSTRNPGFAEPAAIARQSVAGRAGHRRAALAARRPVARRTGEDPAGREGRSFLDGAESSAEGGSAEVRNGTASRKSTNFSNDFRAGGNWRRQASLSQCLESVLAETHYADWLRSRPRGAQRQANVERFLGLAQQFDQFQRQGLFRFLKFIEAQRAADAEPEVAAVAEENAVRLMSIHQSKGLEFPVVVVADLAKPFNEQDLRGEIIFDEEFGLCPRVKPPHTGRRYPSLPHWLAQRHQRREQRGEELRLLYVAMTRARDTLILTATVSENKWETLWSKPAAITTQAIVAAKSYADWLGLWFGVQSAGARHMPQIR